MRRIPCSLLCLFALTGPVTHSLRADADVYLLNMPNYQWHAGCFGTANGNFWGYYDRVGMPNFYTGPTAGGIAPMNDADINVHIRGFWASEAGVDGRPADKPGHMDDYYISYENAGQDPYITEGRQEHEPDCIGDFIGLNQRKYVDMDGECDGNIDAYSFVYWDKNGDKRINYRPTDARGNPTIDIQSGLKDWLHYRGYDGDIFTQLVDFNPETPNEKGFDWEDLKAEIDAGYPFMVFLQRYGQTSRTVGGIANLNPEIHGMVVYGYAEDAYVRAARIRTSWGSQDPSWLIWDPTPFTGLLSVRGVIGFRPKPKITRIIKSSTNLILDWQGPDAELRNATTGGTQHLHYYVVEKSDSLNPASWTAVTSPTRSRTVVLPRGSDKGFYRVSQVPAP